MLSQPMATLGEKINKNNYTIRQNIYRKDIQQWDESFSLASFKQ